MDWGSYIISIAKPPCKKIGAFVCSMKFLSPEVALYLCNLPFDLAWNTGVMSGLVLLVATWNCWISYKKVYAGLPFLHLLSLLNPWLIFEMWPALSLSYRYYFGRCSSELAQLVPRPYSRGRSTRYSDRLDDFSVTIPRCDKDVYVNSFFPGTARL